MPLMTLTFTPEWLERFRAAEPEGRRSFTYLWDRRRFFWIERGESVDDRVKQVLSDSQYPIPVTPADFQIAECSQTPEQHGPKY